MDKLRQTLVNAMEIKDVKRSEVAKKVGISSSRVTEFLNDEQELTFDTVLDIVRVLAEDKEIDLMNLYIETISKPKNLKMALEYCSNNRLLDLMHNILNTAENHSNKEIKEYYKMYSLIYKWQIRDYDDKVEFYAELRETSFSNDILQILHLILETNLLYAMKEYKMVKTLSGVAEKKINCLEDCFVKDFLIARVSEMIGYIELKINCNFLKVQESADKIIFSKVGYSYKGFAYYLKGMSEMHLNFDNSLNHFNKAIEMYKRSKSFFSINAVKRNIALLYFVWEKRNNDLNESKLYNEILLGSPNAERIFLEKDENFKSSPLGKCLHGCIEGNVEKLHASLSDCIKQGDNLTSVIPKSKLLDLGESEDKISIITNYMMTA